MEDNIISYLEMCNREGASLQRGMNFRLRGGHSVILMSVADNAPYQDRVEDGGETLVYEGHNQPARQDSPDPKRLDQLAQLPSGRPTDNGKFADAARSYRDHERAPHIVQVYEKIKKGIWSDNGFFELIDSWRESDGHRQVFKFKLRAIALGRSEAATPTEPHIQRRIIPSAVKLEVWKRDRGRCVECGAADELHFDHIVPFSKGGTSLSAKNVQLLCARHNLKKHAHIR